MTTDRDLFAMHAMAALVAQQKPHNCPSCGGYNKKSAHVTLAEMAYVIADECRGPGSAKAPRRGSGQSPAVAPTQLARVRGAQPRAFRVKTLDLSR